MPKSKFPLFRWHPTTQPRHSYPLPVVAIVLFMLSQPVDAQIKDGSRDAITEDGVQEVLVTARKRLERAQDIPESITVFTSEKVLASGINDIKDVARFVPNLTIRETQQPGAPIINIRGISQFYTGEQPIALVIDGVQTTDFSQITQELYDVESIEVLKGPQGSVYGRNAIGGAINITTKRPTDDFRGFAQAEYGRFDDARVSGAISGPLVAEKLLFRVAASYRDFDGDIPYPNAPYNKRANWQDDRSIRGLLLTTPTDTLSIDFRYAYQDTKGGDGPYVALAPGQSAEKPYPYLGSYPNRATRRMNDASAKLSLDLDSITLTSVTALSKVETGYDSDADYSVSDFFSVTQDRNNKYLSQEFRVSSGEDGPLLWLVGAYYLRTNAELATNLYARSDYLPLLGLSPDLSPYLISELGTHNHNNAYSAFGQSTYRVNAGLELSLGLRYDIDKRRQTDLIADGNPKIAKSFTSLQPKFSVTRKLSKDNMFYGTIGKGFRSGGFNHNDRITRTYKKEELWNYEAGFKSALAQRRINLTAAAFYQALKDRQVFAYDFGSGSETLANPIPKSRVIGIEADINAAPIEGLELNASLAVTRSKILRFDTSVFQNLGNFEGNRLPQVAGLTYALSGQYKINLGARTSLTPRVEANGSGDGYYWEVTNRLRRRDIDFVNVRLTLTHDVWSLMGYVENLFDKRYVAEVFEGEIVGSPGTDYNAYGAGLRQWGIRARVNF